MYRVLFLRINTASYDTYVSKILAVPFHGGRWWSGRGFQGARAFVFSVAGAPILGAWRAGFASQGFLKVSPRGSEFASAGARLFFK